jgi:hypothetical protein
VLATLRIRAGTWRESRRASPKLHLVDRLKLLIGARVLPSWRRAIAIVQPETVLDIDSSKPIEVTSVLGGLHVDYRRAA